MEEGMNCAVAGCTEPATKLPTPWAEAGVCDKHWREMRWNEAASGAENLIAQAQEARERSALRDEFAKAALTGLLAAGTKFHKDGEYVYVTFTSTAYAFANAMLAARSKT